MTVEELQLQIHKEIMDRLLNSGKVPYDANKPFFPKEQVEEVWKKIIDGKEKLDDY